MNEARPNWRRLALGSGAAMFVGLGLGRFSYSVMVPALVEAGALSKIDAGYVGWINLLGFMIGAFCSEMARRGAVRQAVSLRALLGSAVWVSVLALAASALPWGFGWLGLCRGLLGLTAGLIMVLCLSLITEGTPEARRPRATAVVFAGVGLGFLLSGLLVPWLLQLGLAWAWLGIALAGGAGAVVARWGFGTAAHAAQGDVVPTVALDDWPRHALLAAHFLFSFGIVPHTIYWVDFIAIGLGQGIGSGGLHWSVVGVFAVLGPWLTAWLAGRIGTARALVLAFLGLGIGIGAPALATVWPVLWLSTVIFGAQPGLSSVIAARARDLCTRAATPRMMRDMILANSLGAAVGGLVITRALEATGSYPVLFLLGGGAMTLGALLALPRGARQGNLGA